MLPSAILAIATLWRAHAALFPCTDPRAFAGAIADYGTATEGFDTTVAGTAIPSGGSVGGLTFGYSDSLGLSMPTPPSPAPASRPPPSRSGR